MNKDKNSPDTSSESNAGGEDHAPRRKFLDTSDSHAIVLGKLRTEEEARLAAEIELLRR